MKKQHAVFDTEIIGTQKPVFLVCVKILETGERLSFWHHKRGDPRRLFNLFSREDLTFVGFNSIHFDSVLINAACCGYSALDIKKMCSMIIEQGMKSWDIRRAYPMEELVFDHIDLIEVAPGVRTSLKEYEGRMHFHTLADLPFGPEEDLTPRQQKLLEEYCFNDIEATGELFKTFREALTLREHLSERYGIDLRSKSDAQIGEAIMKQACGMGRRQAVIPSVATYTAPDWIKVKDKTLVELIERVESTQFRFNEQGYPIEVEWMNEPIEFAGGTYKFGLGGLHSQHDRQLMLKVDEKTRIHDFDVTSYYPNLLMRLGENQEGMGRRFIDAYREIYQQRVEAKKSGNKLVSNSLKVVLNSAYGKLGSMYSALYAPGMMLNITLTGQLNLLTVIGELSRIKGVRVVSANTDGICVKFDISRESEVRKVFAKNSKATGFEWESTEYRCIAFKDVNNYIAIKPDGSVKAKGLYGTSGVLEAKSPTMGVCSEAAAEFLARGLIPEKYICKQKDFRKFIAVRKVKGGGEQGGKPFGRVARWYMTRENLPPLRYLENGNKVPKTDGARICLELPSTLPPDLDKQWYVDETYRILKDMGV